MGDMEETYNIKVQCLNCGDVWDAVIPKGVQASETDCKTCECKTVVSMP